MGRKLKSFLCAVLLCAASFDVYSQHRRVRNSEFLLRVGDEMPSFRFSTLDGDTLDSDFLRGQVCVLQFAASWCPFSQAQLVDIQYGLWAKHRDDVNFAMIGLCVDDKAGQEEFLRQRAERSIDIPFAMDEGERIYKLFVTPNGSVTRTVIFGADGKIVALYDAHTRSNYRHIRRIVRRLLAQAGK